MTFPARSGLTAQRIRIYWDEGDEFNCGVTISGGDIQSGVQDVDAGCSGDLPNIELAPDRSGVIEFTFELQLRDVVLPENLPDEAIDLG